MRVLYASDVAPADTTSGAKIIYRHLRLLAQRHEVMIAHFDGVAVPGCTTVRLPTRPLAARGLASRRRRHFEAFNAIVGFRARDSDLLRLAREFRADVVLTLAEGGLCYNAARVARRIGKPLAAFFHDWSPDWRDHPAWSRRWMNRAFRRLYQRCALPLCISRALQEELGPHAHATILPPIPDPFLSAPAATAINPVAVYAGVLNGLAQTETRALGQACLALAEPAVIFFGPRPHWGDGLDARMIEHGILRGFMPLAELDATLAAASCLLVIMPFSEAGRRFATYSFPSKLTEYTRLGRPIVIWGPKYCSAVDWAQRSHAALAVTDASPEAVLGEILRLSTLNNPEAGRLGDAARSAYVREFLPSMIQQKFELALSGLIAVATPAVP